MPKIAPELLNQIEIADDEWVNLDSPPIFTDVAEGVAHLDELSDEQKIEEFHEQARKLMENRADDPSAQSYFMRIDTKSLIRTEKEYNYCVENQVPLRIIPHGYAVQLLKEEDAAKRQKTKARQKKKVAKKSRRKNR